LRWVNPKAGYVFQIRMIKVENTTQPPPTQFAAIERNFHETQAGQGLRKSHTPKKVGVRFGVRAISLNCVDLRGPNTQKHMYCVEFLRVASRFDSFSKSLSLRGRTLERLLVQLITGPLLIGPTSKRRRLCSRLLSLLKRSTTRTRTIKTTTTANFLNFGMINISMWLDIKTWGT
jgi:hypothetical protein